MLNPKDREAIEGLFWRLNDVEAKAPQRDREAEDLIRRAIADQPAAPYYMAQTILVQESALKMAEQKIADLERRLSDRGRVPSTRRGYDGPEAERFGGGGGFLAGAAQTAMGVAGGVLLGSAIASMFGAGAAQASEWGGQDAGAGEPSESDAPLDDQAADDGGDFDGGGDFGDFGDIGGEF